MKKIALVLLFSLSATMMWAQRVVSGTAVEEDSKEPLPSATEKARASRTQLRTDEREVTRLTRELERARRQAQKEKLAARKAKKASSWVT